MGTQKVVEVRPPWLLHRRILDSNLPKYRFPYPVALHVNPPLHRSN
ncbi:hypothetical protein BVRB_9g225810 [Beta vulgaris subsp. vulgaris]|uniref:Uncharacterized protein n=1 Tax=Beta vulgaris subsp. vulgaris TaxID=3555 RepID=A0A0J8B5T8_BETVV|nr:hypothetical protein BVRB_9g225810 [Beta vulgaris subsp. vulgaris]